MSRDIVKDGKGNSIGALNKINNHTTLIEDNSGKLLGRVWNGRTFDRSGALISQNNLPGMLFNNPKKK